METLGLHTHFSMLQLLENTVLIYNKVIWRRDYTMLYHELLIELYEEAFFELLFYELSYQQDALPFLETDLKTYLSTEEPSL